MSEITLTSSHEYPLQALVGAALENQQRILLSGLNRTEANIRGFEDRFGMNSKEFEGRLLDDELEETLDFIEWMGEIQMQRQLVEKLTILRDITIAN